MKSQTDRHLLDERASGIELIRSVILLNILNGHLQQLCTYIIRRIF